MNFLKQTFLWGTLLASFALLGYVYSIRYEACVDPLQYRLGTIDPRFNIGVSELEDIVENATLVWEETTGKNLFVPVLKKEPNNIVEKFLEDNVNKYYVRSPIVINLIYDERQERADRNKILTSKIDNTKETADDLKQQISVLQEKHRIAKIEFEELEREYRKGKVNRVTLERKVNEVNSLVEQINALVKKYNALVKEVNSNVEVVNENAGEEFEEGEYKADRTGERINIYEFENRQALLRVLSHEFGHALGMDHVENRDSIMYYLNESENMNPTSEDISALGQICKGK